MILLNPDTTQPEGTKISLPSVVFNNINSLSIGNTGGLTGRFARVVSLLCSLVTTHDVICLQDIRIANNHLITEIYPFFPGHKFYVNSSNNKNKGGTLVIVTPKIIQNYSISHDIVFEGSVQHITLTHHQNNPSLRIINAYLDASSEEVWNEQISSLRYDIDYSHNTMVGGDFNHVYTPGDRSGFHTDKTSTSAKHYQCWLTECNLQQIEQSFHTWYGKRADSSISSSKLDRVYHNFDFNTLSKNLPNAHLCTFAPYTVAQYGLKNKYKDDKNRTTLIDNYKSRDEGGTHVTDHVPLSIRFSNPNSKNNTRFKAAAINRDEFVNTFDKIWTNNMHSHLAFDKLQEYKDTLISSSIEVTKHTKVLKDRDPNLWEAVRLVSAIDQGVDDIKTKFAHVPDYLLLSDTPDLLIDAINKGFAAKTLDEDGYTAISRIEAISRTLPKNKDKITHLYNSDDDSITNDPKKMDQIITKFWGGAWDKKHIDNPTPLFEAYSKNIKIPPSKISLDSVKDAILNSNDSAVGPDGIPFVAYRVTLDFVAPIILECIKYLMEGNPPPGDFNGGLLHLLPKKNNFQIEDTRPLVINNTDNRIIATIVRDSIVPALDTVLSNNQNGFRRGRDTTINIRYFNERFYKRLENREFYDILLVDFSKAFDSISHEAIFKLLKSLGFDSDYINIIKSLFHNAFCYSSSARDSTITFSSGVKQGCPLSPTLFIAITDVLIDMLEHHAEVDVKFYADDAAVGSEDITPKLSKIKECFDVFASHTGLVLNPSKTAMVATGGKRDLRTALDNAGWSQIDITPSIKYLGIHIGHGTTLDEIFKGPYEKMLKRLDSFSKVKLDYSVPKRVTIWNTWILPIFSYVFNFYTIPSDYLSWVDRSCRLWLRQGNTFATLHYTRPTSLLGLASPLKDTAIYNYCRLASLSTSINTINNSPSWSARITTHLALARDHVQTAYGVSLSDALTSNTIYTQIIHSREQSEEYHPYIKDKLDRLQLSHNELRSYIHNYKKIPRWIPCYIRYNNLSISHNMLPTYSRFGESSVCFLCGRGEDSAKHLYGNCKVVAEVHRKFCNNLNIISNYNFACSMAADKSRCAEEVCILVMLSHSVWRASCLARKGDNKPPDSWVNWIIEDCTQRISTLSPSFFSIYFPNNTILNRYKICYRPSLGSSKKKAAIADVAAHAVSKHINNLPDGTLIAFTDGSAKPNPGPAGAGAIIVTKNTGSDSDFSHVASYTAAVGNASNNTGELFAVGIVLEHCKLTGHTGDIHIYTDSKISYGALNNGWRAGRANSAILYAVRDLSHCIRHRCKIHYHWIPGHSGIDFNNTADALANAGSDFSKSHRDHSLDFSDNFTHGSFLTLVTDSCYNLF